MPTLAVASLRAAPPARLPPHGSAQDLVGRVPENLAVAGFVPREEAPGCPEPMRRVSRLGEQPGLAGSVGIPVYPTRVFR